MIINRPFWQKLIQNAWQERTIIWLMGARRVGKTSLCKSLSEIEYFDCEIPRVRQLFADPEDFLNSRKGKKLVLDEIHRLDNPSELLKIAADYYPDIKIIATGSSTLGASKKFKDTLTGRKREIWLTPLLLPEMRLFGSQDIRQRFLFGGFPSFFVKNALPESDFQEWIDAFWAKDIQDIFSVEKRSAFQKFTELLLANSSGLFEATRYTVPCEISRPTVLNYLTVLEETFIVHVIRPYSTHKPTEIVLAPKIYGFDTGFVCFTKGWRELRQEDLGLLWEHCVLNEIHGQLQTRAINYWRDKTGHEIDFVLRNKTDNSIIALECKYLSTQDTTWLSSIAKNFAVFRSHYPDGENLVIASNVDAPFTRNYKGITISFIGIQTLIDKIKG